MLVPERLLLIFYGVLLMQLASITAQYNEECSTSRSEPGVCIKLHQCQYVYNLMLEQEISEENRNYLTSSQCGYVEGSVWVCCPNAPRIQQRLTANDLVLASNTVDNVVRSEGRVTFTTTSTLRPTVDRTVPPDTTCSNSFGIDAVCIELKKCPFLLDKLRGEISARDRSLLQSSQCGFRRTEVLVCCPIKITVERPVAQSVQRQPAVPVQEPTERTTQPPTRRTTPRTTRRTTQRPIQRIHDSDTLPDPPECGISFTSRIYGGSTTSIGEYPWSALIEYIKPGNLKGHHCGGSLINSRYVLTAGHCVGGRSIPSTWRVSGVRLGEWDTTTNPDCVMPDDCAPPHIDIDVVESIQHPLYNRLEKNQPNDIALLRLAESIVNSAVVKPICLPKGDLSRNDFSERQMEVAGWGKTENASSSNRKLKAYIVSWKLEDCSNMFSRYDITLQSTHMCAGGAGGIDPCRGDSGGALVAQDKVAGIPVSVLAGVVSFGTNPCGLEGWPGVYTRVGAYMDWIQSTIRK